MRRGAGAGNARVRTFATGGLPDQSKATTPFAPTRRPSAFLQEPAGAPVDTRSAAYLDADTEIAMKTITEKSKHKRNTNNSPAPLRLPEVMSIAQREQTNAFIQFLKSWRRREPEMVRLTDIAKQASAKMRRLLNDDPLLRPLGRTADSKIDEALATRTLERADLFKRGNTFAPHRHRIAAMLAVHKLSPRQIVAHHWPELKDADQLCASCINKKRCESWLRGRHADDAPRRFCPNAMTFERWRRDRHQYDVVGDKVDGDAILEVGLVRTREMLRRIHLQGSSPSDR